MPNYFLKLSTADSLYVENGQSCSGYLWYKTFLLNTSCSKQMKYNHVFQDMNIPIYMVSVKFCFCKRYHYIDYKIHVLFDIVVKVCTSLGNRGKNFCLVKTVIQLLILVCVYGVLHCIQQYFSHITVFPGKITNSVVRLILTPVQLYQFSLSLV